MKKSLLVLSLLVICFASIVIYAEEKPFNPNQPTSTVNLFYLNGPMGIGIFSNGLLLSMMYPNDYITFNVSPGQLKLACFVSTKLYTEDYFKIESGKIYNLALKFSFGKSQFQYIDQMQADKLKSKSKVLVPTYHN